MAEFREHPTYKNRLTGHTMYKRIQEGHYRDYAWESDICQSEMRGEPDLYGDWLSMEVGDVYMENAEIVQVNLYEE